jgi:hypothetical protein
MRGAGLGLGLVCLAGAVVSVLGCGGSGSGAAAAIEGISTIGLNEKRVLLEMANTVVPQLQKEIDETVGKHVPLEVDWASFGGYTGDYYSVQHYRDYGFDAIPKALKAVAKDDLGKRKLAEKLTRISLKAKKPGESAPGETLVFDGSVLSILQGFDGQGVWGEDQIREALEKKL